MSTTPSASAPSPVVSLAAAHDSIFDRLQPAINTLRQLSEEYRLSIRLSPTRTQSAVSSQFVAADYALKYLSAAIDALRLAR